MRAAVITLSTRTRGEPRLPAFLERYKAAGEPFGDLYVHEASPGGAAGCFHSHLNVLALARDQQWGDVVLLEDDACFRGPIDLGSFPDDWQLGLLGVQHHIRPHDWPAPVVRPRYWCRSHAYAVRATAIQPLIERLPLVTHWDDALSHAGRSLHTYALNPAPVGQVADVSDVSDSTPWDADTYWDWPPPSDIGRAT